MTASISPKLVRGKLLTLEGGDGAGKSSHVNWLASVLHSWGHSVVRTREPGGTPLGEKLRAILLSDPMCIDTELLLMFAARRQHMSQVIEPALARGDIVICDRFTDSSYAFQGGGRMVPFERIKELDAWCRPPRPDLTLLFDVPVEIAMARIGDRVLDRFEQEQEAFHERVRAGYRQRAAGDPERIKVLDGSKSIEEIRAKIGALLVVAFGRGPLLAADVARTEQA